MSLREVAEQDLGIILEDLETGFGWPITLTAPDGTAATFTGFASDISQLIDPDTGQAVSGRLATITLRNAVIDQELPGKGLPINVVDTNNKPWLVSFDDINGVNYIFKVAESNPDRTLGLTVCILELYK